MEDALELIEREAGRLTRHLQAVELQHLGQSSSWWWKQVTEAKSAWEDLARWRFGQKLTGPWPALWASKLREEEDTLDRFEGGALNSEQVLVFTSFVRCWVSDEQMLVAGLYNGALQAVHWKTGQKENFEFFEIRANRTYPNFMKTSTGFEFLFCLEELLRGRHGDEVIAVALNEDHILSGSGDPGYYDRRPLDASVRLWRRSDGAALGCFEGHADSVRCVALFKTQPLMRCGMSGSLDCHLILWNLTNGSVESSSLLNGPCRCMSVLCEDVDSDTSGARARILAGSGEGVAELALTVRQGAVTVTQLRFVSAYVDVSSLSYFDGGYRQEIEQGSWPKSFLATPMRVAVGSVDGQFALLQGGSCRAVHELFKSRHGNCDVVSIVMISERRILLVSRAGILTLLAWNGLLASDGPCRQLWSKTGWRMYTSTIGLWGPRRLISDGFDNVIRVFTLESKFHFQEMVDSDDEASTE